VPPFSQLPSSSTPTEWYWDVSYNPPMLYLNRQRECILFSFLDGVRAIFSCLKSSDLSPRGKVLNLIPHCHGIRGLFSMLTSLSANPVLCNLANNNLSKGHWEIREDFMFSAWEGKVFAFAQLDWSALDKGGDQP